MKYLNKTFSSGANSKEYRDNWDKVFGNNEEQQISDIINDVLDKHEHCCLDNEEEKEQVKQAIVEDLNLKLTKGQTRGWVWK